MHFLGRPKRPTIRNPWTTKRNRHHAAVSTPVLGGLAILLLVALLGTAWVFLQAAVVVVNKGTAPANNIRPIPENQVVNSNIHGNTNLNGQNNNLRVRNSSPEKLPSQVAQTIDSIHQHNHAIPPPPPQSKNNGPAQQQSSESITPADGDDDSEPPLDEDQVGTERLTTIDAFRQAMETRYGTEVSKLLREKALQSFGSLHATANRFLQAVEEGRPLRLGFAGYSITVGRGNYFHQSYPFVLYHLLAPLLQHTLELPLSIKNAAIGGIPSFPYGFCLEHFLGSESFDMVSWDYSMNEGGNTAVLESYIRHAQQAYPATRPMILALDKHKGRCQLLDDYTQKGLLHDALCVAKASEIIPKSILEKTDETTLPPGLQKWSEFGAPKKCPGRGSWHPKKMEHAAIAWTMASYFVDALELAMEQRAEGYIATNLEPAIFPPPLSTALPENPPAIQSLLYGHGDDTEYQMHTLSCRTNFEPAADHDNLLTSIITAGMVPDATAETILEKRSDEMYSQGWVLDVSELERDTKIKVDKCGGLGYIDMKMALYGIGKSGPLDLWLPVDESGHETHDHVSSDGTEALHWIESLVVCEANEKRPETACRLTHDLQYTVGGVEITSPVPVLHGAGEYLKRPTCVAVPIPTEARLTQNDNGAWGLPVRVQPASRITREGGACCLSHLVWEHTLHED